MALPTYYSTGTASVSNGATAVTGIGTSWLSTIRAGDLFGTHKGMPVRIASVNSNTSLTLAYGWAGATQSGAAYEIQLTPRTVGVQEAVLDLLERLSNGNLATIAELSSAANTFPYFTGAGTADLANLTALGRALIAMNGAANKLPYFTGAGTADQTDLTALGRALIAMTGAANKLPYFTGAGTAAQTDLTAFARTFLDDANGAAVYTTLGQVPVAQIRNDITPDKAFRQGNILGTVSQSGGAPTGAIVERGSNANGEYVRFADGTQICTKRDITLTQAAWFAITAPWTFPAAMVFSSVVCALGLSNSGADFIDVSRTDLGSERTTNNSSSGIEVGFAPVTGVSLLATAQINNVRAFAIGRWF